MRKVIDFCTAIAKTWELKVLPELTPIVLRKLKNDVYISFSEMICTCVHAISESSERIKIIDYLKQEAQDLNFQNGYKQKTVTLFYRYMPHLYIHLRYFYGEIV